MSIKNPERAGQQIKPEHPAGGMRMLKREISYLALILMFITANVAAWANDQTNHMDEKFSARELLVRFNDQTNPADKNRVRDRVKAQLIRTVPAMIVDPPFRTRPRTPRSGAYCPGCAGCRSRGGEWEPGPGESVARVAFPPPLTARPAPGARLVELPLRPGGRGSA